jgi:hypothetical protein
VGDCQDCGHFIFSSGENTGLCSKQNEPRWPDNPCDCGWWEAKGGIELRRKRVKNKVRESKGVLSLDKQDGTGGHGRYDYIVGKKDLEASAAPRVVRIEHEEGLDAYLASKKNDPAWLADTQVFLGTPKVVHRYLNKVVLQNITKANSADLISLRTVYDQLGSKDLPFIEKLGLEVSSAEALPVWSCDLTGAQIWSYTGFSRSHEEARIRDGQHPVTYFLGKRYSTASSLDGHRKPGYARRWTDCT